MKNYNAYDGEILFVMIKNFFNTIYILMLLFLIFLFLVLHDCSGGIGSDDNETH